MPQEEVETPVENAPPEDFAEYEAWAAQQDMQPGNVTPAEDAIEDDETASEAPETPEAETAAESETAETQEQEKEDEDDEEEPEDKPKGGVQKRISKLTKKIRELEERLSANEPKDTEVAEPSAAEKQDLKDAKDGKPVAPKLADFESYELYEAAHAEFVDKLTDWKADQKEQARQAVEQKAQLERAQAEHQAKWGEAASRFDDFNEVVGNEDVKISAAMESVLRGMEAEVGTALSYYLGKHPEESLRIAKATLADNEPQWRAALARAGRELGKLEDKLPAPKTKEAAAAPAPKKVPPKITAAPKPPAKVAGTRNAAPFDVHDEKTAEDFEAWERAREKQLRRR